MKFSAIVFAAAAACGGQAVFAEDSTALFEEQRRQLDKISFFCETGRAPARTSYETLNVTPSKDCSFSGPLDSKINRLNLEPPFLNPQLTLLQVRNSLVKMGAVIEREDSSSIQFRLNNERLSATRIEFKQLKDTLMRLGAYPANWGKQFTVVSSSNENAIRAFADLANTHAAGDFYWSNSHFNDEAAIWPRMLRERRYLPVELIPRCKAVESWPVARRSLMLVGDMHTSKEAQYFLSLVQSMPLAFAGIEISRDRDPELNSFLKATTAAEENAQLDIIVNRLPREVTEDFRNIFRTLKRRGIPIVLIDYSESYLNFPFTNTAFHGAILAARNKMWVDRLPAVWSGTGVVMAGLAHFTQIPGADMQNFILERFPGLPIGLINPLENCFNSSVLAYSYR